MNLECIVDQYAKNIERIMTRADRQSRQLTDKERLGILYYRGAGSLVQSLILPEDAERPGFEMKSSEELAPVTMGWATVTE